MVEGCCSIILLTYSHRFAISIDKWCKIKWYVIWMKWYFPGLESLATSNKSIGWQILQGKYKRKLIAIPNSSITSIIVGGRWIVGRYNNTVWMELFIGALPTLGLHGNFHGSANRLYLISDRWVRKTYLTTLGEKLAIRHMFDSMIPSWKTDLSWFVVSTEPQTTLNEQGSGSENVLVDRAPTAGTMITGYDINRHLNWN